MRRSLAAVLAADIAGYSAMMQKDSARTLEQLERLRNEILKPAFAAYRGRLIKSMGDGWIVVFDAVADAVECAMQIQDRVKSEAEIELRMGLSLGDVAETDDDVFGDGVNIAARLEALADPGTLAISASAYDMLDGTLRPSFDNGGSHRLKNITQPVTVWVRGGDVAGNAELLKPTGFPTLAIRPVLSNDERDDLHEIATALTGELAVYLNAPRCLKAKISESGSDNQYILTCRLRASGDRLRLEGRLTNQAGDIVTIEKHDGDMADVFGWQDHVTGAIANRIIDSIIRHQAEHLQNEPAADRTGRQWILIGLANDGMGLASHLRSLECYITATKADPELGYAYAQGLATVATISAIWGTEHLEGLEIPIGEWVSRLEHLEPPQSPSRLLLLFFNVTLRGDTKAAGLHINAMLRDAPFDPETAAYAGWINLMLGRSERALECFRGRERWVRGTINQAGIMSGIGRALLQLERFDEALPYFDEAIELNPDYLLAYRGKASALAHLGELDRAREALSALPENASITRLKAQASYPDTPQSEIYHNGLRLAGMPD